MSARDWSQEVAALENGDGQRVRIRMGSPGSAQVTRVRLLKDWEGIDVRTESAFVVLERTPGAEIRRRAEDPVAESTDSDHREDNAAEILEECRALLDEMVDRRVVPGGFADRVLSLLARIETPE